MIIDSHARENKVLASFFRERGVPLACKKGRRLAAGDIADKIVYVKSGYLAAYLAQPNRIRARAYYTFGPGDFMQIRSLVMETRFELVYTALTNVSLYVMPRELIWQEVNKNPTLATGLIRDVVWQNELHARRIENLSYRYASDKLIYRILSLAERFGAGRNGSIYVRIPVTHRQLGLFINMARESVSREMEKLVERGFIQYERQHITILNVQGLIDAIHETVRTDWRELLIMAKQSEKSSKSR